MKDENTGKAEHDYALRFLRADHGQRVFPDRLQGSHRVFRRILPEGAGRRRLRHHGGTGAAHRLHREPALLGGGHRLPAGPRHLLRGMSGLSP